MHFQQVLLGDVVMLVYSYVAGEGVELTVHKESVVVEKIKEVEPRSILRTNRVHGCSTRISNRFCIPFCRTNIRKFSDFYQGPVFFNKLSAYIRDAPSLYSFQSRVKNFFVSCY